MIKIVKPALFFTLYSLAAIVTAQNNTHSPYSGRGLGEQEPFSNAYNRSLGGVSNGIRSTRFISFSNPASLSGLKQVVFDFGFSAGSGKMSNQQSSSTFYNGNFNYVVIGFPVWQKEMLGRDTSHNRNKQNNNKNTLIKTYRTIWSSALGMAPYSNLGASSYKVTDTTYGRLVSYYTKSGGLSNVFLMNAVNLSKNVSLGLNAGYVFGQIRNNTSLIISDSGVSRALEDVSTYYVHGFKFDFGIQSQHHDTFNVMRSVKVFNPVDSSTKRTLVSKKIPLKIVFGATYTTQSSLNYQYSRLALNKSNYYLLNPADTIINNNASGKTSLPGGFSAGFSVKYNNQWLLAFDYATSFYSKIKNPLFNDKYTNSSQYSLGIAYRPDLDVDQLLYKKGSKMKTRPEYRAGFRYFNTGYNFKDNTGTIAPLVEYGITAGVSLPLLKSTYTTSTRQYIKSSVQFSMEYIHRGTTKNGMVEEHLLKLTVGVTLGDIWFTKRKFY